MKPVKINFTDHFLYTFNGTQEELDLIVTELQEKISAGEFTEYFEGEITEFTVGVGPDDDLHQTERRLH
jgi:hypothetical protein